MYTEDFASIYEPLYRHRGKDWTAEAERVGQLIREKFPSARSLLDVACGTGTHLATFAESFSEVEGLEIAPAMRAVAQRRLPQIAIHAGDMRSFDLGRTYDAVTCLFNSIAYVDSNEEMVAAFSCMATHLRSGGVLIIEPWWSPERFLDRHIAADAGQIGDLAVARVSHSTRSGRRSRLEARFLVARPEGIQEFTHVHNLMLFTEGEYFRALDQAGFDAEFLEGGLTGRGLFIANRR
ncbi:class I SAM-dependent methyltransferase [Micromonospora sediminicola]|uniref:class I SAM-dependent methyltransferase n=1 Tax=Micromonospora sediminicola TaxID=946078 RepID=UPI0033D69320